MAEITLYQFESSHYNEKARWALDLKGVPHERVSLLPGPHRPRMKRLTGRTQTPALVGRRFSIADLTCAALLMPAVDVAEFGGPPTVGTDAEHAWLARWTDHPGTAWVRDIYRRHRRP